MSFLMLLLVLFILFFVFVPVMVWLAPYLIGAWLILAVIDYFRQKRLRKKAQEPPAPVKRNPEAIDVDYVEYKTPDPETEERERLP